MDNLKLFMVLPAYNESENLPALMETLEGVFARLARLGHERAYVIVDDGSKDATPEILRDHATRIPIEIITHHPNQGLGPTIRDGLKRASEMAADGDIILSMDADNTHPAGLMVRMVALILEGNDVVIASRYQPGARIVGLSGVRKLMSFGARLLFQAILPIPGVRDYTCGFRAYRATALKRAFRVYGDAFIEHRGFQCMADILLKLAPMKLVMNEVPMVLRYDWKLGESKMRVSSTVMNTIKLLIKRRFDRRFAAALRADGAN